MVEAKRLYAREEVAIDFCLLSVLPLQSDCESLSSAQQEKVNKEAVQYYCCLAESVHRCASASLVCKVPVVEEKDECCSSSAATLHIGMCVLHLMAARSIP